MFNQVTSKAAASEEPRRTLLVREDLSAARTKLKACFNSLARVRRGRYPIPYSNRDSHASCPVCFESRW